MEDDLPFIIAEGFALLGMRREAMEALRKVTLSDKDREGLEVALGFMIRTAKSWQDGEEMARKVTQKDDEAQREAAGRFWLGKAKSHCADHEYFEARQAVGEMLAVWPEGWDLAMHSKELPGIW